MTLQEALRAYKTVIQQFRNTTKGLKTEKEVSFNNGSVLLC